MDKGWVDISCRPAPDKGGLFRTKRGKWEGGAPKPRERPEIQDARAVAWERARIMATVASISFNWSAGDFSGQIS